MIGFSSGLLPSQASAASTLLAEPPALAVPAVAEADARTLTLARNLRCPVCQGQAVADSQAESALAMRNRIHELVQAGYSDLQIEGYFVDLYGDWVLLQPPTRGLHWAVWLLPFALLVGGAGWWLRKLAAAPVLSTEGQEGPPVESDDPYVRRVLAELDDPR